MSSDDEMLLCDFTMAPSLELLVGSVAPCSPMSLQAPAGRRCRVSIHPLASDVEMRGSATLAKLWSLEKEEE